MDRNYRNIFIVETMNNNIIQLFVFSGQYHIISNASIVNNNYLFYYITLKKQIKKNANSSAALFTFFLLLSYEPRHE